MPSRSKQGLDDVMRTYGYAIDQALVTDIQPDEKVKAAMNDINAAQREQVAATARGEAEKILKVKQAEAEAQEQGSARPGHRQPAKGNHRRTQGFGGSVLRKRWKDRRLKT